MRTGRSACRRWVDRAEVLAAKETMDRRQASTEDGRYDVAGARSQPMDGRVVVVSGGTHGLGEATVRLLAERGAAGLVIAGRDRRRAPPWRPN